MKSPSNDPASPFPSAMDAKEFLASRIAAEAAREGKPLSELERQMLFFSETHESLPNILDINAKFEEQYDAAEYENRVEALIEAAYARDSENSAADRQRWQDAVRRLESEDHYILIMLHAAGLGTCKPGLLLRLLNFLKPERS